MTTPTFGFLTGTQNLGKVFRISNQINAKFIDFNIPFTDTTGRISANLGGKTRIITIQGAVDGTGWSGATTELKHKDFVDTMESWINASTQTSQSFTDSLNHSYSVDAIDWTWAKSNDDPMRVLYTLIMIED